MRCLRVRCSCQCRCFIVYDQYTNPFFSLLSFYSHDHVSISFITKLLVSSELPQNSRIQWAWWLELEHQWTDCWASLFEKIWLEVSFIWYSLYKNLLWIFLTTTWMLTNNEGIMMDKEIMGCGNWEMCIRKCLKLGLLGCQVGYFLVPVRFHCFLSW